MVKSAHKASIGALIVTAVIVGAVAARRDRGPSPDHREQLSELARRVADAESGLGDKGRSHLGRSLTRLRGYGYRTENLAVRIQALAGDARIDPVVLEEVMSMLDDLTQMDSRVSDQTDEDQ